MTQKQENYESDIVSRIIVDDDSEMKMEAEIGSGEAEGQEPPRRLVIEDMYRSPLIQGIVWSEVLGRPVSRRKSRGRHSW